MSERKIIRTTIRLPKYLHDFTMDMAKERGLSFNAVLIFALEFYYMQEQVVPHLGGLIEESRALREEQD